MDDVGSAQLPRCAVVKQLASGVWREKREVAKWEPARERERESPLYTVGDDGADECIEANHPAVGSRLSFRYQHPSPPSSLSTCFVSSNSSSSSSSFLNRLLDAPHIARRYCTRYYDPFSLEFCYLSQSFGPLRTQMDAYFAFLVGNRTSHPSSDTQFVTSRVRDQQSKSSFSFLHFKKFWVEKF